MLAGCIGFVLCICGLAQSSSGANSQLLVQVRSEATIARQGENSVSVKVRLAPGTQVKVWAEDSCSSPAVNGQVIAASGTYAIVLEGIIGTGKANVCLESSDGSIRTFLLALGKP